MARYCLAGGHASLRTTDARGPKSGHDVATSLRSSLDTQSLVIFATNLALAAFLRTYLLTDSGTAAPVLPKLFKSHSKFLISNFQTATSAKIEFVILK